MAKSKQRTTFAKLDRERRVQEKRVAKQLRKDERREEAARAPVEAEPPRADEES